MRGVCAAGLLNKLSASLALIVCTIALLVPVSPVYAACETFPLLGNDSWSYGSGIPGSYIRVLETVGSTDIDLFHWNGAAFVHDAFLSTSYFLISFGGTPEVQSFIFEDVTIEVCDTLPATATPTDTPAPTATPTNTPVPPTNTSTPTEEVIVTSTPTPTITPTPFDTDAAMADLVETGHNTLALLAFSALSLIGIAALQFMRVRL